MREVRYECWYSIHVMLRTPHIPSPCMANLDPSPPERRGISYSGGTIRSRSTIADVALAYSARTDYFTD